MMEVHIKITKDELQKYKEYAHIRRRMSALCDDKCGLNRQGCCGCPEQSDFAKRLDKTGIKDYDKSGVVKEYVEKFLDFCDAKVDYDRATDRLNNLRRECDDIYSKFEVVD